MNAPLMPRRSAAMTGDPAEDGLRAVAVRLIDEARAQGADACKVSLAAQRGIKVVLANGIVFECTAGSSRDCSVVIERGGRSGVAWASSSSADPATLVADALALADHATEGSSVLEAAPEAMAWDAPDVDIHHPVALGPDLAIALARACEAGLIAEAPNVIASAGVTFQGVDAIRVIANSAGLLVSQRETSYQLGAEAVASDDRGNRAAEWHDTVRRLSDMTPPDVVGRTAARRALARRGSLPLPAGTYRAIFEPQIAAELFEHVLAAMEGPAALSGGTWLSGRLGTAVTAGWMNLAEDPLLLGGLASAGFDEEGYATAPRLLIKHGVLDHYLHTAASAAAMGKRPTGHAGGARNVTVVVDADRLLSPDGLRRRLGDGVLIQNLFGHGIDLMAGRFSFGAAGTRVRDGELAEPVEGFMIWGSYNDLLIGMEAMSDDLERRGNIRVGAMLSPLLSISN